MFIFVQRDNHRGRRPLPDYDYTIKNLETRTSVWKDDNKVSVTHSEFKTGINRKQPGHRWFRWQKMTTYGFFRNSNGLIVPYVKTHANKGWGHPSTCFYNLNPEYGWRQGFQKVYAEAVKEVFGVERLGDLYPVARHYNIETYDYIPKGLAHAFRNTDTRSFVEELYGKKNYRKDLVKAVAGSNPIAIALTVEFKNLVPIDWIINFLRESPQEALAQDLDYRRFRSVLTQINPKSYRSLLKCAPLVQRDLMHLGNVCVINQREGIRVETDRPMRTWTELHDRLIGRRAGAYTTFRVNPFEDQPIEETKTAKKLNQLSLIQPATHTKQMVEWGNAMNNCIASYRRIALDGIGEYAAVIQDGKLLGNLEIRHGDLIQLLGKNNQALPDGLKRAVVRELNSIGINTRGNWWGKENLSW